MNKINNNDRSTVLLEFINSIFTWLSMIITDNQCYVSTIKLWRIVQPEEHIEMWTTSMLYVASEIINVSIFAEYIILSIHSMLKVLAAIRSFLSKARIRVVKSMLSSMEKSIWTTSNHRHWCLFVRNNTPSQWTWDVLNVKNNWLLLLKPITGLPNWRIIANNSFLHYCQYCIEFGIIR